MREPILRGVVIGIAISAVLLALWFLAGCGNRPGDLAPDQVKWIDRNLVK